jgi:pyrimidine-specific ribonucleoside hydrolase
MGGAVKVPGNLQVPGVQIDNRVAEWNIYVDPHAAAVVFESGAPITLVPLDATNDAPLTMAFYKRLEADHTTPEADFVYQVEPVEKPRSPPEYGLCVRPSGARI